MIRQDTFAPRRRFRGGRDSVLLCDALRLGPCITGLVDDAVTSARNRRRDGACARSDSPDCGAAGAKSAVYESGDVQRLGVVAEHVEER